MDLPKNKRIDVALRYLYGIGEATAAEILVKVGSAIPPATRVKDLTEQQASLLNNLIVKEYKVEGELRRELSANLQRLQEIGSYRGSRYRRNLPVRGQRTRTNARTRRGRRKTIGVGKATEKPASAA
jgi:small subunit ribosomal protein S13